MSSEEGYVNGRWTRGDRPEMLSDRLGYPPEVGDDEWAKRQTWTNPEDLTRAQFADTEAVCGCVLLDYADVNSPHNTCTCGHDADDHNVSGKCKAVAGESVA